MARAFDTLGFVRTLEDAGISRQQAEAHVKAFRDNVMPELAIKADIQRLEASTKTDVQRLEGSIQRLEIATKADIQRLEIAMERIGDRITIRVGGLVVIVAGLFLAVLRMFPGS